MFRDEAIYRSIHAEKAYPLHEALPDAGPSQIDLWELSVADEKQDIEGWRAPFDGVPVTSAEVKLSKRIQSEIGRLVAGGTMTGRLGNRRRLTYGDVLVLVRRRGNLFDAVIQALKHAGIPVAGADRLKLTEHIGIIDLMNLADALLLPQDDLALAVALKSPLFNLTEDELFTLAWNRKGTLRDALTAHAAESGKFRGALDRLAECERRFRTETPFAFYAWLLGGDDGRARILRRLGHEANDALDEFLELAMSYEKKAPASLQGFMAWLRAADTEVKRDMEISRDEVRVMTVHGAKGLEAPVVIMADTTTSPSDTQRLRLIHLPQANGGKVMVWAGRKADDPRCVADARNAMLEETEHEYRRLLYVAMTRAADRLIVAGCMPGNRNSVRENSWYDLVKRGLANSDLVFQEIPSGDGVVKSYRRAEDAMPETDIALDAVATTHPSLPEWLRTAAAPEQINDSRLRPSDPGTDEGKSFRSGESLALRARVSLARHAGAPAAAIAPRARDRAPPRRGIKIPRAQRRRLDRRRPRGAGGADAGPDRGCAICTGIFGRKPRRGLDRRTAGTAGAGARPGFGANRPAGDDARRGPDRRLQDQSCPAECRGGSAPDLCPPARALPRGARKALSPITGPRRVTLDRNA